MKILSWTMHLKYFLGHGLLLYLINRSINKNPYKIGSGTKSFFKGHRGRSRLNFAQIYISNVKNQRPVKIFRLKVAKVR